MAFRQLKTNVARPVNYHALNNKWDNMTKRVTTDQFAFLGRNSVLKCVVSGNIVIVTHRRFNPHLSGKSSFASFLPLKTLGFESPLLLKISND